VGAFRLRIPVKILDILQKVALARWSRTVSALVNAGVPLLAALDQVAAAVKSLTSIFEAVMLVVMGGIVGVYDQIR